MQEQQQDKSQAPESRQELQHADGIERSELIARAVSSRRRIQTISGPGTKIRDSVLICKKTRCRERATLIAEKGDWAS